MYLEILKTSTLSSYLRFQTNAVLYLSYVSPVFFLFIFHGSNVLIMANLKLFGLSNFFTYNLLHP